MSDEPPEIERTLPVRASIRVVHRVGAKCVVSMLEDGWCCAHGTNDDSCTEDGFEDLAPDVAPSGAVGIDPRQARIYFRREEDGTGVVVRVVELDDIDFRTSTKGRNERRSKSFDRFGVPVPEVRLLFALKTGRIRDRVGALFAFPFSFWNGQLYPSVSGGEVPYPTLGDIFREIEDLSGDEHQYRLFVGRMMAEAAADADGLTDWALWDKTAKSTFDALQRRIARDAANPLRDFSALFIQAVKETALDHAGLPAQSHVRARWEKLGGQGDWRENRSKLGFDWLPSLPEWKEDWLPSINPMD